MFCQSQIPSPNTRTDVAMAQDANNSSSSSNVACLDPELPRSSTRALRVVQVASWDAPQSFRHGDVTTTKKMFKNF